MFHKIPGQKKIALFHEMMCDANPYPRGSTRRQLQTTGRVWVCKCQRVVVQATLHMEAGHVVEAERATASSSWLNSQHRRACYLDCVTMLHVVPDVNGYCTHAVQGQTIYAFAQVTVTYSRIYPLSLLAQLAQSPEQRCSREGTIGISTLPAAFA